MPHLLIVDDNELNVRLFRDLLGTQGYETLHAGDGAEGLALARAHRPGLIIMDLEMPVMCGREAMGRVKRDSELRAIPVIAVSAFPVSSRRPICPGSQGCPCAPRPIMTASAPDTARRSRRSTTTRRGTSTTRVGPSDPELMSGNLCGSRSKI